MGLICARRSRSAPAVRAGVTAVGIGLGIINPDPPLWSMPALPSLDRSACQALPPLLLP